MTRQLVRSLYPSYASVTVVSHEDATALRSLVPNLPLRVIPNGVDAAEYAPRSGVERAARQLLFTGALNYPPNVHAAKLLAQEILPRVRESVPVAHLRLVGRDPSETVTALENHPGVEVIPNVPDMAPFLSEATVFVCPMTSGTGIKNKLLEAMANELPCVTTPLALRGIEATPGSDVLVGSDVDELSAAAVRLLGDSELRSRLGNSGRALVERDHSWQSVAEKYTDLYEEII
jgi:glycosyltransferase involved in cell wall biosynthesis